MKFLILMILSSFVAHATILIPLDEDQVINSSNVVIFGEVVDKESNWGSGAKRIFTDYKVKVIEFYYPCDSYSEDEKCQINESLSNSAANKSSLEGGSRYVYVRTLGGSVSGVGMKVAGSPQFKMGSKFMFLLRELRNTDKSHLYKVVGFSQGLCKVSKGESGDDELSCVYDKTHKHNDRNVPLSGVHGAKMSSEHDEKKRSLKGFKSKLHKKGKEKANE